MTLVFRPEAIFDYAVIMIDEVHERDRLTDQLLGLLHRLLFSQEFRRKHPGKKFPDIIFMSATMHTKTFFDHYRPPQFWQDLPGSPAPPPHMNTVFHMEGHLRHPIDVLYLEDLKTMRVDIHDLQKELKEQKEKNKDVAFYDCYGKLIWDALKT